MNIKLYKEDIEFLNKLNYLKLNTNDDLFLKDEILRHLGALNTIFMLHEKETSKNK